MIIQTAFFQNLAKLDKIWNVWQSFQINPISLLREGEIGSNETKMYSNTKIESAEGRSVS